MIRLGSLAGYSFEGPRVLAGWTAPAVAAVYAVLYPTAPGSEQFAVCYVGHTDDLTTIGFPFRHPRAPCWTERAGNKFDLRIATFEVLGGTAAHREQIVQELIAVYHPSCNEQQYDNAWEPHWIGSYESLNPMSPAFAAGPWQSEPAPPSDDDPARDDEDDG